METQASTGLNDLAALADTVLKKSDLTDATDITTAGYAALDAKQNNPNIENSLANKLGKLNSKIESKAELNQQNRFHMKNFFSCPTDMPAVQQDSYCRGSITIELFDTNTTHDSYNSGKRAGIGFHNVGVNAAYLYYNGDGFYFITHSGKTYKLLYEDVN